MDVVDHPAGAGHRQRLARGTHAPEPTVVVVEKHVTINVIQPRVVIIEARATEQPAEQQTQPMRRIRAAYDQPATVLPRWIAIG